MGLCENKKIKETNFRVLNLSGFGESDIKFDLMRFPDGQPHFRLMSPGLGIMEAKVIIIMCSIRNADDLFIIAQAIHTLKDLTHQCREVLDGYKVKRSGDTKYILYAPYIFAGRSDKDFHAGDSLDFRSLYILLRSLRFDSIISFDPHCDINSLGLTANKWEDVDKWRTEENPKVLSVSPFPMVDKILGFSDLALCFPDKSAYGRVLKKHRGFDSLELNCSWTRKKISLEKYRGACGEICSHRIIEGQQYVSGSDLLVVDDICDGGATFVSAANILKDYGADRLFLYVSHGLFSKGLSHLFGYFRKIYCTNSVMTPERQSQLKAEGGDKLEIINLFDSSLISENFYA